MKTFIAATAVALSLAACQTISEDSCRAGDWESIGYDAGARGKSRGYLGDISEGCSAYSIRPDRTLFLRGYDAGLRTYCTPDRGRNRGLSGRAPHDVCTSDTFPAYASAFDAGVAQYRLEAEYASLIDQYNAADLELTEVTLRLADELLPDADRRLFRQERVRLVSELEALRLDIRAMQQAHALPVWDPA